MAEIILYLFSLKFIKVFLVMFINHEIKRKIKIENIINILTSFKLLDNLQKIKNLRNITKIID